jgi:hypothetical protein
VAWAKNLSDSSNISRKKIRLAKSKSLGLLQGNLGAQCPKSNATTSLKN